MGAGERDGSVVQSTGHSSRGPDYNSLHLYDTSKYFITEVTKKEQDRKPRAKGSQFGAIFWPLWVPGIHVVHRHTQRQNNYIMKINNYKTGYRYQEQKIQR